MWGVCVCVCVCVCVRRERKHGGRGGVCVLLVDWLQGVMLGLRLHL